MDGPREIKTALISVFDKTGLDKFVNILYKHGIRIISTGGTLDYVNNLGIPALAVEEFTSYPSILGGRVKTLHPKIFGGILGRRDNTMDKEDLKSYEIPEIDMVVVDLYPFEKTVLSTDDEQEIIEKIDIGGISLIRAAAKNYKDVLVIPSSDLYEKAISLLEHNEFFTSLQDRKEFAAMAFNVSSHYDALIFNHFNKDFKIQSFKQSILTGKELRYGENPHQKGVYFGNPDALFEQLNGKAISYNNLNDLDAAVNLIDDFTDTTFAIIKHNNACGLASRSSLPEAWKCALAGDPVSAFGGVLVTNASIDEETAAEINNLFFEIILAPGYDESALELLKSKKNRIILKRKPFTLPAQQFRSALCGVIAQDKDLVVENEGNLTVVTAAKPSPQEISDLLFANIIVKHTKSNTIVLAKDKQLVASGVGQTSRVDALKQAIEKAKSFGFNLKGAVMASDAFFPFADSVEISHNAGITAVVQPGGSVRDKDSIDYCNNNGMAMVFTGFRHFKH
nr:bifunctional phosphoribosylaminoimidazolecarboxamide formyltransferase/IMP cyclohydrolase [Bacteroidota bacterium]